MLKKSATVCVRYVLAICVLLVGLSVVAIAQDQDPDYDRRYQLALKIQSLQPISDVAENAVNGMAVRYPEDQRTNFKMKMMRMIDFTSLEKDAARSMADTFTLPELQVLYAYRSSKEGKSIREKTPIYQTLVEKDLFKYLDKALMEIRTGGSAEVAPK